MISSFFPRLKKVIYLSTIDIYKVSDIPITESSEVFPQSMYAASKFYCEQLISTRAYSNNYQCSILRIGHVFGPGEHKYHKLIPNSMRCLINNEDLVVLGDGKNLRNYIFIDDVINSIISLIRKSNINGLFNIVGSDSFSVVDTLELILKMAPSNYTGKLIFKEGIRQDFIFDNEKMKKELYKEFRL